MDKPAMDRAGIVGLIGEGVSAGLAAWWVLISRPALAVARSIIRENYFDHPGELQGQSDYRGSPAAPRPASPPRPSPAGALGDLHPDHGPFPTADINAPPLHDGISLNHQPSHLIDREAVGQ
jgi:hypothetical protein